MSTKIEIRPAHDNECGIIKGLVTSEVNEYFEDMNWDGISNWWLVAENEGEILACIQILIGQPIGMLEYLSFKKGINDMQRARVTKLLLDRAFACFAAAGIGAVAASVRFEQKFWKKILKKHWNFRVYSSGNMLIKRIA